VGEPEDREKKQRCQKAYCCGDLTGYKHQIISREAKVQCPSSRRAGKPIIVERGEELQRRERSIVHAGKGSVGQKKSRRS